MRACRNDRAPRSASAALAGLALAAFLAAPASAEVGPPIRLLPPATGTGPAIPDRAPTPAAEPAAAPEAPGDAIQSTPLTPVDASWAGTLGDGDRPLPQTMWQGTPRALVVTALPLLAPSTSPALHDLARRLLLSNAVPPAGQDPADGPSLAALRIERLAALGEVDGALAVLEALPATRHSEALDRLAVELRFAKLDRDGACRQVQESVARYQGTWWDRALIACQALAGDQAKASLGLSLLREQKVPREPSFDTLIEILGGRAAKLDKLRDPTPLTLVLLAAAKLPLPAEAVAAADPPSLFAWANNTAVPPLQRLAAAERAAALGALAPDALGELYGKIEFKPEELGQAIKQGKAPATPRDRALLYAVARTDPAAEVRAMALEALLAEGRKREVFAATARLLAPLLAELPPGPDLRDAAPDILRALYAAGRGDAAAPWLALLDPAAAPTSLVLAHLALGAPAALDDKTFHDALAALRQRDAAAGAKQGALLLTLWAALGEPVNPADGASFLAPARDATMPSAALWLDQQQAAAAKRLGETVLATLVIARAGDRLSGEPIVLGRVVAGLKSVGLDAEARAVAVEAALAAGI